MDGQYVVGVETGNAINWTTNGSSGKKTYEFVSASEAAMKTDAQSVYYVEQVSRSMSPTNISTMTLTLSCGRMMGKPSVIDYMLLLYKPFFDPALGFCADITEINQLVEKYNGKTKSHTILSSDSLVNIAYNEYGLKGGYQDTYTADDLNNATSEQTNGEENEYPYSLENLCSEDKCSKLVINGITNFDNVQSINLIDFIDLFKRVKDYTGDAFTNLTSIIMVMLQDFRKIAQMKDVLYLVLLHLFLMAINPNGVLLEQALAVQKTLIINGYWKQMQRMNIKRSMG